MASMALLGFPRLPQATVIRWWCFRCHRYTVGERYCGQCGAPRP